jgi:hypothetical protein
MRERAVMNSILPKMEAHRSALLQAINAIAVLRSSSAEGSSAEGDWFLLLGQQTLTTMNVLESDLRAELASIDGAIWEESVADSFRQARA